jgi:hypothetical protein
MKGTHEHSILISPASWWFSSAYILLCLETAVTGFVSFEALRTVQWAGIFNTAGCSLNKGHLNSIYSVKFLIISDAYF